MSGNSSDTAPPATPDANYSTTTNNNNSSSSSGGTSGGDGSQTYFIGNLPRESTEVDVLNYFASYGPVERFKLCYSSDGRTRGFGWLTFSRPVPDLLPRGPYHMGGRELTVELSHARIYNRSGVSIGGLTGRRHTGSTSGRSRAGDHSMVVPSAVGATVVYGGGGDGERARRGRRHSRGHHRNRSSSRSSSRSSLSSTSSSYSSLSSSDSGRKRDGGGRRKAKHARHTEAPAQQAAPTAVAAPPPPPPTQQAPLPLPLPASTTTAPPSMLQSDMFVCLPMSLCPPQFLCDPRVFAARLDRTRVGALTICGSVMQAPFVTHEAPPSHTHQPQHSSSATSVVAGAVRNEATSTNYGHMYNAAASTHASAQVQQQQQQQQHSSSANMPSSPPPSLSSSAPSALRHGASASHPAPFASYAPSPPYGVMPAPAPPLQHQRQSMHSTQR